MLFQTTLTNNQFHVAKHVSYYPFIRASPLSAIHMSCVTLFGDFKKPVLSSVSADL